MNVGDIVNKANPGDEVFVVQPMIVRWGSMRFENTAIVQATYVVGDDPDNGLWGNNRTHHLKAKELPTGTKKFPQRIYTNDHDFQCFFTREEAEVWKIIELQDLEQKVEDHIIELKKKTQKKIKTLKRKEKLDEYLEKYPEKFIKVL
jgi:hypothetical protein